MDDRRSHCSKWWHSDEVITQSFILREGISSPDDHIYAWRRLEFAASSENPKLDGNRRQRGMDGRHGTALTQVNVCVSSGADLEFRVLFPYLLQINIQTGIWENIKSLFVHAIYNLEIGEHRSDQTMSTHQSFFWVNPDY